jgi:hypothetical protein
MERGPLGSNAQGALLFWPSQASIK